MLPSRNDIINFLLCKIKSDIKHEKLYSFSVCVHE